MGQEEKGREEVGENMWGQVKYLEIINFVLLLLFKMRV